VAPSQLADTRLFDFAGLVLGRGIDEQAISTAEGLGVLNR